MERIPIGKMAEMNHSTVPTLRLYDKLGLLTPRYVDPETGYRYYDIHQNARLDMISYMKELGMSLSEIGEVLKKEDISLIEEVLARKNEQIHMQIRSLENRHDAVKRAISSIERYRKSPVTGTTSLEYIDRRRIWGIPCSRNFYEDSMESYELVLAELREELIQRGLQQIHSYNVGTSILQADFETGNYQAAQVFVFVDEHFETKQETLVLESGMYACIYLDSYEEEIQAAQKLLNLCREHHYHIAGDYICEVLTEFNVFDGNRRNMFLRLQVPVKFLSKES